MYKYKGLEYYIKKSHFSTSTSWSFNVGWGNGYVRLPKTHEWYGVDYDLINLCIHGGLTYGSLDKDGYWVLGFDTAHSGDDEENCNEEYVLSETRYMVYQCLNPNFYCDEDEFHKYVEKNFIAEEKRMFREKKLKRIL